MSRTYSVRIEVASPALGEKERALFFFALDEWELAQDLPASELAGRSVFAGLTELVVGVSEAAVAAEYADDAKELLGPDTQVQVTLKHLDMTKTPLDLGPGNTYLF